MMITRMTSTCKNGATNQAVNRSRQRCPFHGQQARWLNNRRRSPFGDPGESMEYEDARSELLRHAGIAEDYYEDGFLACLRPYSGIKPKSFHTIIESILSVGSRFSSADNIDRPVVCALWSLTTTARNWGTEDDGMLVRNKLISPTDRKQLRQWISIIESTMLGLLHGRKPYDSIHRYCEYVVEHGWGPNFRYFIPLLSAAIDNDDFGDRLQGHCEAIISLGPQAIETKGSLERARLRKWGWYEPQEQCAAESLRFIDQALSAIERDQNDIAPPPMLDGSP